MKKFNYNILSIDNNLRILHLPLENSESVFISLIGKVGRRAENESEIGAAHFLEHLLFDGTIKRPSPLELGKYLQINGAQHNGGTGSEIVEYFVKILPEKAEIGFDFISDIYFNSLLTEVEKERKVIGQELAAKKDDPVALLQRLNLTNLYPGQAIGRTIYDDATNLETIDIKSLRDYMDRNYVAQNFILVVAGNIDEGKTKSLAQKYFQQFPSGSEVEFVPSAVRSDGNSELTNRDFNQSKLAISYRGYQMGSLEAAQLSLLSVILGRGSSSRLYDRLRSQLHLVYSVSAIPNSFSDSGSLNIHTYVDEKNVQRATDVIFEEINKLLAEGISDEELEKAKNTFLAGILFGMEDISAYANYFSRQLLLKNSIKPVEQLLQEVQGATKGDLEKVAKYVFSDPPKINLLTKNLKKLKI